MPARTCSSCKTTIKSDKLFFCFNCGNELLIRKKSFDGIKEHINSHEKKRVSRNFEAIVSSVLDRKGLFLFVLIGIVLVILSFILSFHISEIIRNEALENTAVTKEDLISVNVFLDYSSENLFGSSLAKLTPSSVDLYMESVDAKSFFKTILMQNILNFSSFELEEYLDGPLSVFGVLNDNSDKNLGKSEVSWGIISSLSDVTASERIIEEMHGKILKVSGGEWFIKIISGRLLLTNDSKFNELVDEASDNLILNLSLTPDYLKTKKEVKRPVQVWVLKLSDNSDTILKRLFGKNYLEVQAKSYIITEEGIYKIGEQ